jgi:hypothetical protein
MESRKAAADLEGTVLQCLKACVLASRVGATTAISKLAVRLGFA